MVYSVIFIFLCADIVTAASQSNPSILGPSDVRRITMSRVVVLSRFLGFVFIRLMVENPPSQSAVEIRRVRAILAT